MTLYVILGVVIVLLIGLMLNFLSNKSKYSISEDSKNFYSITEVRTVINTYINLCIKNSVERSIEDTGIRLETIDDYKAIVNKNIKDCSKSLFSELNSQGYSISEGLINLEVELHPETITVVIEYPLTIEKSGQKIDFDTFFYTFDRSVTANIPGGTTDREIRLVSSNGKAELVIPEGVTITDEEGNPVEKIGIRVEDLHFDGLENRYVLGQLVYENFPDGIRFSSPAELTIEFREKDIPPGYTRDNIKIGWWNKDEGIWYAGPTSIKENRATTNITHFSKRGTLLGKAIVQIHKVMEQRFYPWGVSYPFALGGTWFIAGEEGSQSSFGEASLAHPENKNTLIDFRETMEKNKQTGSGLVYPKIEYGYFENSKPDQKFTPCEGEGTSDLGGKIINYYMLPGNDAQDPNNKPYFDLYGGEVVVCSSENKCPLNENDDKCLGVFSYSTPEGINGKVCRPTTDEGAYDPGDDAACCLVDKSQIIDKQKRQNSVFGWHNYRCVGGKATPADGQEAADILIFEPNGNAVTDTVGYWGKGTIKVGGKEITGPVWIELPAIGVTPLPGSLNYNAWENDLNYRDQFTILENDIDLTSYFGIDWDSENSEYTKNYMQILPTNTEDNAVNILNAQKNQKLADERNAKNVLATEFECYIQNFDGEDTSWKRISLSAGSIAEFTQKYQKDNNLGGRKNVVGTPIPVYGIYGVNLVKKPKKDQLQAFCEVAWHFWGSGILDYYPQYDTLGTYCDNNPTDKVKCP